MPLFRHSLTRRDAVLVIIGATLMHLFSTAFSPFATHTSSTVINTYIDHDNPADTHPLPPPPDTHLGHAHHNHPQVDALLKHGADDAPVLPMYAKSLPETTIVEHAPGWTIFKDLYMADGTLVS